ncbi:hypothetical protein SpCBS45565_g00710 [Spizellomyces sp. 'palustris']|nr:hypothetical protein SpCBS45565_g00710 [Spizellomyces sp. 'palustris']
MGICARYLGILACGLVLATTVQCSVGDDDDEDNELFGEDMLDDDPSTSLILSAAAFATRHLYWLVPTMLVILAGDIVLFFYAAGRIMKDEFVVVRATELTSQPPAVVWNCLTDWAKYSEWRRDIVRTSEPLKEDGADRPDGEIMERKALSRWIEVGKWGRKTMTTVIEEVWPSLIPVLAQAVKLIYKNIKNYQEKSSLQVRLHEPLPSDARWPMSDYLSSMTSTWTIEITSPAPSSSSGCVVYLTQQIKISSPSLRLIIALIGFGGEAERWLADLAAFVGEKDAVVIRPVDGKLTVE